jgi:hypothetical protein
MAPAPSAAASRPRTWQSLLRLPPLRRLFPPSRSAPAIGAAALLLLGLGGLAVTVGATSEQIEPRWDGRIDDGLPAADARTIQLLGAAAVGLETEARQLEAEHGGSVRTLDAEIVRLRDTQAELGRQQVGLESRLAAAIELAAVKGDAFDLVEEVRALRLVPAALLLREAAETGRPFAPALDQFAAVAARVDDANLETEPRVMEQIARLQPHADTGVVSWRDLRRSFASLPDLIERADASSWWERALVMIGWNDDPLAPLHEAQAALMVDDLDGAIAALAALQGEAALVTEGWLALARARVAADAAVDQLYQVALDAGASLSPAGSTLASSGPRAATQRSLRPAGWRAEQAASTEALQR